MLVFGGFCCAPLPIVVFGYLLVFPFDFLLLILWFVTAIILRKKAPILFPPHVYWLFMSQGIMVHAIMSFTSLSNLDLPSLLAHALKISEYYSFILIYLLYKSTHDGIPNELLETVPKLINNKDTVDKIPPAKLELTKGNK